MAGLETQTIDVLTFWVVNDNDKTIQKQFLGQKHPENEVDRHEYGALVTRTIVLGIFVKFPPVQSSKAWTWSLSFSNSHDLRNLPVV